MGFTHTQRQPDPSPKEIAKMTKEIREGWDEAEYEKRSTATRSSLLRICRSWVSFDDNESPT